LIKQKILFAISIILTKLCYGANVIGVVEGHTKQSVEDLLDKSLTKQQKKILKR